MNCISTHLPYRQTGAFSKIILDYLDQDITIKPFFPYPPTLGGVQKMIEQRKSNITNRDELVQQLRNQYESVATHSKVKENIESLLAPGTFTVTTAHQNNIFTGPLYFIYKIVHAIKVADYLNTSLPAYHFVPVFYMGSEDADFDELNHIHLRGEKLVWDTKQTGAVGRMKVDKGLTALIRLMEGQLSVLPYGNEIVTLLKNAYQQGFTIEQATFQFLNTLFADYGLVVLSPDKRLLKKQMIPVFQDDLLNQTPSGIVQKTTEKLQAAGYKIQANPRKINLFYLKEDSRERIEKTTAGWKVINSNEYFSENELLAGLKQHPEHFSPNVILRGLYQETILPDVAFIGGGSEIAYWLQLKELFAYYKIPFPVLVLRNSFLLIENKWQKKISKLGFTTEDFFLPEQALLKNLVVKKGENNTQLNDSFKRADALYASLKKQVSVIDPTLEKHIDSLQSKAIYRLQELEKKMLRAEKRKLTDQQRQIHTVKENLFPNDSLQERHDNFSYYYAKWGKDFIQQLYQQSLCFEQEFTVLQEK